MAIGFTLKTQGSGTGNPSTASITGTLGNTILIFASSVSAVSGASITGAVDTGASSVGLWTATATGSAGAITLTTSAAAWQVVEVTGGATSLIQIGENSGTGTTASASLSNAVTSGNATIAHTFTFSTAAITPKSGWTELDEHTYFSVTEREIQYVVAGEQAVTSTWSGSASWQMLNAEIGVGSVASGGATVGILPVGF